MRITTTLDNIAAATAVDGGFAIVGKTEDGKPVSFMVTAAEVTVLTLPAIAGPDELAADADPERVRPNTIKQHEEEQHL